MASHGIKDRVAIVGMGCTRFAEDIAGDPLIDFGERGGQMQVITYPDDPFTSYFSGNTVQVCPVGALTAKPYRFRARPWDLASTETTCTTCAVGCRGSVESSSNQIVRMLGVDVEPTNHGWLCDKGRFGHEATHAADRLRQPMVRRDGERFVLVEGLHRLEACKALGETKILALLVQARRS